MARLRSRLLLASGASAMALLAGEVLVRVFEPPTRPGSAVLLAANGQRVPMGEIVHFMTRMQQFHDTVNAEQAGPHGLLQANHKLRMGYDQPKPRWDYFDEHGCVAVDTNSLGFRDLEFAVQKQPGEFRVLALGDSFTFGQGVRLDLTWPQVLEAMLRGDRSGPVEVVNAGFAAGPGVSSPDGYDRWLGEHGIHFAPDVVVVGLCLNDLGTNEHQVPMLSYVPVGSRPVLGGHSRLLDYLVWCWRVRTEDKQRIDVCRPVREHPEAWQGTQRGLLAMQSLLAARSVPLVVAVFPMLSEPGAGYPYAELHELVVGFCGEQGVRCVDLRHAFDGLDETGLWVHFGDQHPNHVGHRIMATWIRDYLVREGLVPKP